HVRARDEEQKWFARRAPLEAHEGVHRIAVDASAESVHRFRRIGEDATGGNLLERRPNRRLHFLGRPEWNREDVGPHSETLNSASARAKSSSSVILSARSFPRTTTTGMPRRSQSAASSVAESFSDRARRCAVTIVSRGKPCGVC